MPPNQPEIVLASASQIRARLLQNAGLRFSISPARIDEEAIRQSCLAEGASARDLADRLAELKAVKVSAKYPQALTLGADQILECNGQIFSKPSSLEEARQQLRSLSGQTHQLFSALVVSQAGSTLWRHVGQVSLRMHDLSDGFIDDYLDRNGPTLRESVGCYRIEEEGVRLFADISGDYFHILGLPLTELLTWMHIRGDITT